ncbi:Peroxidase stcC [Cladobotryum mycophilum]|uniref:Peroxidase stcC n=1 Tax=Cladobotryum mycophilum TaxID=491253 RepID=A0ABR0SS13_9HYPO
MKFSYSLAVISSLSSVGVALPQLPGLPIHLPPIFNPNDPRFDQWQPAGPNDSRSPCPGLNSLANHGFLPRNGRNVTAVDIIRGIYQGLGASPEIGVITGVAEVIKAYRLAAFDLEELANHGFIEHDCSMSREDLEIGNNNDFNASIWSLPLQALMKHDVITPQAIGEARSARDLYVFAHNPKQQCGARAIAVGAFENGLLLTSLGGRPNPILINNVVNVVAMGLESLVSQPRLMEVMGNTVMKSPADLLAEVFPIKNYDLSYIASVVNLAGFPSLDLSKLL